ncbi:hypothetical protein Dimus_003431 [Dionaea muscipula]
MDNPPHRQGIPSSGLAGLSSFRQAPALSSSGSSAEPNTATLPPSSGLAGFHSLRRAQAPSPISATVEHRLPSAELASPPGQAWHPPPSSGHAGHRPPDATPGSHPPATSTSEVVHLSSSDVGHTSLRRAHNLSTSM